MSADLGADLKVGYWAVHWVQQLAEPKERHWAAPWAGYWVLPMADWTDGRSAEMLASAPVGLWADRSAANWDA